MKILLLNPHFDSQHEVVVALQGRGAITLVASTAEEAAQILGMHGSSVELAVIHREGESIDSGIGFLKRLKADALQADLPVILTSSEWSDDECAAHQSSPEGANAYLKSPYTPDELLSLIEVVFGSPLGSESPSAPESPVTSELAPSFEGNASLELPDPSFTGTEQTVPQAASDTEPGLLPGVPELPGVLDGLTVAGLSLDPLSDLPAEEAHSPEVSETPLLPDSTFEIGLAPTEELQLGEDESAVSAGAAPIPTAAATPTPVEPETLAPAEPVTVAAPPKAPPASLPPTGPAPAKSGPLAVEDATAVFMRSERKAGTSAGMFHLQAPDLADDDFPVPGATNVARHREHVAMQKQVDDQVERELATELAYLAPGASLNESPTKSNLRAPRASSPNASSGMSGSLLQAMQAALAAQHSGGGANAGAAASSFFRPPSDAVVPGGTMQSPDTETLKKFLALREQDVTVLTVQLKAAQEQIVALDRQVNEEKGRNADLMATVAEHKRKLDDFEREQSLAGEKFEAELNELKFQLKARRDKARALEGQVKDAQNEIEKMKERVRSDIRKIRMREKELENRLEITRKDSEALLGAREAKIIELKRKVDLLEFNMDLLQDQHTREKENSAQLREKLAKAAQVVRVMGGLLDSTGAIGEGEGTDSGHADSDGAATEAS